MPIQLVVVVYFAFLLLATTVDDLTRILYKPLNTIAVISETVVSAYVYYTKQRWLHHQQ